MDVGGTYLRTGLVRDDGDVACFEKSASRVLVGEDPCAALLKHVTDYLNRHGVAGVAAVALGAPATVDKGRRVVLSAPAIPSWKRLDVADLLERALGVPTIVDRDVNMLMRQDIRLHQLRGDEVAVGCYVGTGLGNSISINGSIFAGEHGVAGELGHIPVRGSTTRCGCGNLGCVETLASGAHLQRICAIHFAGTKVEDVFAVHRGHPVLDAFVQDLAMPIASEICILDPAVVIIGGGVVHSRSFPKLQLEQAIRSRTRSPLPASELRFLYSDASRWAGVRGAGICAFEVLGKDGSSGKVGICA